MKQDKWTKVNEIGDDHESIKEYLLKIEVEGGWLYRVVRVWGNSTDMTTTFVPDVRPVPPLIESARELE